MNDNNCERCGATLRMYDGLDTVRECVCPAAKPDSPEDCEINEWSSRVCSRGTRCCVKQHPPDTEPSTDPNAEAVRWLETRAPLVMHRYVVATCMRQFAAQAIAADRLKRSGQPVTAGPAAGMDATCEMDTSIPASRDDLIAASGLFFYNHRSEWKSDVDTNVKLAASFAQTQVDKAIDEFVERVEDEVDYLAAEEDIAVAYREAMRSVAEEMKRK